jgi:hypothetical protein
MNKMNKFGLVKAGQTNFGYIAPTRAEVRGMGRYDQIDVSERKVGREGGTPREQLVRTVIKNKDKKNARALLKEARAKTAARSSSPASRVKALARSQELKAKAAVGKPGAYDAPSQAAKLYGGGKFGGNASSFGRIR